MPPLRERPEDIRLLVHYFVGRYATKIGRRISRVPEKLLERLLGYAWPGNVRELENVIERLVVTGRHELIRMDDLPLEIKAQRGMSLRPRRERRRTVADDLYRKLVEDKQSFWTAVYPLYMEREITKQNVRDIVRRGLEEARGNYKIVCRMFNMADLVMNPFRRSRRVR